jgi:hypothetical protein
MLNFVFFSINQFIPLRLIPPDPYSQERILADTISSRYNVSEYCSVGHTGAPIGYQQVRIATRPLTGNLDGLKIHY